ncbi:MAG: threonine--tRNA ligase, partial [Gemmatimonadota bacterium]
MKIRTPQGEEHQVEGGGRLKEALLTLGKAFLKDFVAARLDGDRVDFHTEIPAGAEVELIPWDSEEATWVYRHSMSHIMAQAVRRLFPAAQLAIGPAIDSGFYYDFDVPAPFSPEDLQSIEKEMKRIVKQNHRFERLEVGRDEARSMLAGEEYKLEILQDLEEGARITFYRDGDFVDLCRGPHVLSTGQVKNFKLLSAGGAYWRGDESRPMLQRIYGTAFVRREALDHHLAMLEEARKRDHRIVGRQLQLFHIDEQVGQGLVLWTPNGAIVRDELQKFIARELRRQGYHQVFTPHIGKLDLYRTSGHYPYYQESQYPPLIEPESLQQLAAEGCTC